MMLEALGWRQGCASKRDTCPETLKCAEHLWSSPLGSLKLRFQSPRTPPPPRQNYQTTFRINILALASRGRLAYAVQAPDGA